MTYTLGVSALYHDSAAALVQDGEIVGAVEEQSFSRVKHDSRFPENAIRWCLAQLPPGARLASAVFYDNPVASFDRVLHNALTVAPDGLAQWQRASFELLGAKRLVGSQLGALVGTDVPVLFADHHLAHAASAFYPAPFDRAAILVVDGVGEWATTSIAFGRDSEIEILREIRYPHSLGLLYSTFTWFCGFKVNSGEYKLMGLAPYGRPRFADRIRERLIDLRPDGSFRLHLPAFDFMTGGPMAGQAFSDWFEGPPRAPESSITRREVNLAASIQLVLEEAILTLSREAARLTDCPNLCLAGGVVLNCVANGRLRREGPFRDLWIQPAAGDAGGALGAALLGCHAFSRRPRSALGSRPDRQRGSRLGPRFTSDEVAAVLQSAAAPHHHVADRPTLRALVAQALADGKIVGYFQGALEFGPRALGGRSILADPRRPEAQTRVNLSIKLRESWRPFAPSILAERAGDYFAMTAPNPYMLETAPLLEGLRRPMTWDATDAESGHASAPDTEGAMDLLALVRQVRSPIPAVTHVDYSARVQTVATADGPDGEEYWQLLRAFEALTGCPVLVNTSFNVRGEPIVRSPLDALWCFWQTGIDLLVLEDHILWKHEQRVEDLAQVRERVFELD